MTNWRFLAAAAGVAAIVFGIAAWLNIDYLFFAGYVVLQYVVLASAWNILGGYTGYMNLGVSAFFALGAYTTVALETAWKLPLPATIPAAAIVAGLVGIGMGYLTLRLKGIFFAIATLALAVVTETFITNWDYVGGSAGAYLLHPKRGPWFGSYIEYLFLLMLIVAAFAVVVARAVERSWLGYGFTAIRDDETAAEATGRTHPAPQARRHGAERCADGNGRRAASLLCQLPRACLDLQSCLCGQHHRHGDDRRHYNLARPADRRRIACDGAAGRDRDDLVRDQSHGCRRLAGRLRHAGAERHCRIAAPPAALIKRTFVPPHWAGRHSAACAYIYFL
jgi:Branched-chain amino acid transport system / permease component